MSDPQKKNEARALASKIRIHARDYSSEQRRLIMLATKSYTWSAITQAAPEKAAIMINQILKGEATYVGIHRHKTKHSN